MLAIRILDVKKCMQCMLASEAFDMWQLAEAKLTTRISYVIDGHITKGYLSEDELTAEGITENDCIPYAHVRKLCFDLIKGKQKPKSFRFTFLLPRSRIANFLATTSAGIREEDVANLTMNISFADGELLATTSCALCTFVPDKTVEHAWDSHVEDFFRKLEIAAEKIA